MERVYYHKWLPSVFPLPSTLSYGAAYTAEGNSVFLQWAKDSKLRDEWMNVSSDESEVEEDDENNTSGPKKWVRRGKGYRWQVDPDYYDVDEAVVEGLVENMSSSSSCDYGGDELDIRN